jgi:hypothetical protein
MLLLHMIHVSLKVFVDNNTYLNISGNTPDLNALKPTRQGLLLAIVYTWNHVKVHLDWSGASIFFGRDEHAQNG